MRSQSQIEKALFFDKGELEVYLPAIRAGVEALRVQMVSIPHPQHNGPYTDEERAQVDARMELHKQRSYLHDFLVALAN
jgi:hypothetical protein